MSAAFQRLSGWIAAALFIAFASSYAHAKWCASAGREKACFSSKQDCLDRIALCRKAVSSYNASGAQMGNSRRVADTCPRRCDPGDGGSAPAAQGADPLGGALGLIEGALTRGAASSGPTPQKELELKWWQIQRQQDILGAQVPTARPPVGTPGRPKMPRLPPREEPEPQKEDEKREEAAPPKQEEPAAKRDVPVYEGDPEIREHKEARAKVEPRSKPAARASGPAGGGTADQPASGVSETAGAGETSPATSSPFDDEPAEESIGQGSAAAELCPKGDRNEWLDRPEEALREYRECLFPDGAERRGKERLTLYLAINRTARVAVSSAAFTPQEARDALAEAESLRLYSAPSRKIKGIQVLHETALFAAPWWAEVLYTAATWKDERKSKDDAFVYYSAFLRAAEPNDSRLSQAAKRIKALKDVVSREETP